MRDLITFITDLFAFDKEHPLLFTQFNFWAFFLLVFAGFCLLQRGKGRNRLTLRNGYLFIVSLFFYFKTSGLFVLLLVFSTFLGYLLGIRMDQPIGPRRRKGWMVFGVMVNLLILCYFKYAYFFTDIHNNIFHSDLQVVNYLALFANHFTDGVDIQTNGTK